MRCTPKGCHQNLPMAVWPWTRPGGVVGRKDGRRERERARPLKDATTGNALRHW